MRTIAIVLCDNDFGFLFRPLLKSIHDVIVYHNNSLKQETIINLVRLSIPYHYLAYKNNHYDWASQDKQIQHSLTYLQGKVKILFDEEAEEHIHRNDHDHGSWYLEIITGQVYDY